MTFPPFKTLIVRREGSRVYVTINRPEFKNAINGEVVDELSSVARLLAQDRGARTIVLRGADGTFCSGGDIRGFKESFSAPKPDEYKYMCEGAASNGTLVVQFTVLYNDAGKADALEAVKAFESVKPAKGT